MKKIRSKFKGFTLTELLVVLGIIGVLVVLAIPSLAPLITRTKTVEAKLQLKHVYTLEESYHYMNSRYSSDLADLGFEQEKLVTEGGNAYYRITISESSAHGFIAEATAVEDFDGDGQFNKWQIDQEQRLREVIPD